MNISLKLFRKLMRNSFFGCFEKVKQGAEVSFLYFKISLGIFEKIR